MGIHSYGKIYWSEIDIFINLCLLLQPALQNTQFWCAGIWITVEYFNIQMLDTQVIHPACSLRSIVFRLNSFRLPVFWHQAFRHPDARQPEGLASLLSPVIFYAHFLQPTGMQHIFLPFWTVILAQLSTLISCMPVRSIGLKLRYLSIYAYNYNWLYKIHHFGVLEFGLQ